MEKLVNVCYELHLLRERVDLVLTPTPPSTLQLLDRFCVLGFLTFKGK